MTITLDLAPEIEERLRQKAARQGEDVASYLRRLAEQEAQDVPVASSDADFDALLDELAEGSENLPVLPPEAFERASFYGGRD